MNFGLTETQQSIKNSAREFFSAETRDLFRAALPVEGEAPQPFTAENPSRTRSVE